MTKETDHQDPSQQENSGSDILKILSLKQVSDRLRALEDKKKPLMSLEKIAAFFAILSTIFAIVLGVGQFKQDERIQTIQANLAQDEFDLKVREVRKEYLDELTGGFNEERHAIKSIAEIEGVRVAIKLEKPFRTGGTITGLKEYKTSATMNCGENATECDRDQLVEALRTAPTALFIDSQSEKPSDSNIYCDHTRRAGGTNLEDIFFLVRDLPMFIHLRIGDEPKTHPDEIAAWINQIGNVDEKPDLIVLHAGSFEGVDYADTDDDVIKVRTFLSNIVHEKYTPTIIIYSRKPIDGSEFLPPRSKQNFEHLVLVEELNKGKESCFYESPPVEGEALQLTENGRILQRAITREFSSVLNTQPLRCVEGSTSDPVRNSYCPPNKKSEATSK